MTENIVVLEGASKHRFWGPGQQMPKIEESQYLNHATKYVVFESASNHGFLAPGYQMREIEESSYKS